MKRFCSRVVAFALLQALILAVLVWDSDLPRESNYMAATIDKHRRLERTHPPRIIFIGGSNLPFGIQSDLLERELGRPVVNMGLIGALDPEFLLNEVRGRVGAGDVVVLSLEYNLFASEGNWLTLVQLLGYRPASSRFVPPRQWKRLLQEDGLTILGTAARRSFGFASERTPPSPGEANYTRQGLNQAGDYTAHYRETATLSAEPLESPVFRPPMVRPMTPRVRAALERFARHCHERGARFVFSCPPRPREVLQPQAAAVEGIVQSLRRVPQLAVLDTPSEQVYDRSLFYDTAYHLTKAGARQRTSRLIRELREVLP
jgi:hypothetical protein